MRQGKRCGRGFVLARECVSDASMRINASEAREMTISWITPTLLFSSFSSSKFFLHKIYILTYSEIEAVFFRTLFIAGFEIYIIWYV